MIKVKSALVSEFTVSLPLCPFPWRSSKKGSCLVTQVCPLLRSATQRGNLDPLSICINTGCGGSQNSTRWRYASLVSDHSSLAVANLTHAQTPHAPNAILPRQTYCSLMKESTDQAAPQEAQTGPWTDGLPPGRHGIVQWSSYARI